jgi:hypothetical protein
MPTLFDQLPDAQLIQACASGNPDAWTSMIERYQASLEGFLRWSMHRIGIKDDNLVPALVSNVWSEQLESKRFTTYDARRGPFRKYLCGLAHKHVLRWLRRRASEARHEHEAMRRKPESLADSDGFMTLMLTDFLKQVSPGERLYIHQELLKDWPTDGTAPLSDANKRQLHHRAVRRLCRLLGVRRLVSCRRTRDFDKS